MLNRLASLIVTIPVHIYRLFVSPLLGPRCRFQPTCSEYALDAVRAHGAWVGLWLAMKRLARCHPIARLGAGSGFDPVPVEISRAPCYAPWRVKSADEKLDEKNDNTDPA